MFHSLEMVECQVSNCPTWEGGVTHWFFNRSIAIPYWVATAAISLPPKLSWVWPTTIWSWATLMKISATCNEISAGFLVGKCGRFFIFYVIYLSNSKLWALYGSIVFCFYFKQWSLAPKTLSSGCWRSLSVKAMKTCNLAEMESIFFVSSHYSSRVSLTWNPCAGKPLETWCRS